MSDEVLYEVTGPKNLFEMTWEEVADALKETDIVILPVGSVEQHGTHLPLGSDTIQGTDIGKRVTAKLEEEDIRVVAAPTIPFGISHAHMKFPGTITLSSHTLSMVTKEVCQSLYTHGFRKFVLLLSHGGNLNTLRLVADDLVVMLPEAKVIVPDWLPVMGAKYQEVLKSERPNDEHHSGEGETARMLVSTPRLVKMNRAKAFYVAEEHDLYKKKPYPGSVGIARGSWGMKEMTSYGVMGNPNYATVETGEKLYEIIVEWLCQVIKTEFY